MKILYKTEGQRVVSPTFPFALSRFASESFRPPTLSHFAHYLISRFAHFLNLYFIEDIVKITVFVSFNEDFVMFL